MLSLLCLIFVETEELSDCSPTTLLESSRRAIFGSLRISKGSPCYCFMC